MNPQGIKLFILWFLDDNLLTHHLFSYNAIYTVSTNSLITSQWTTKRLPKTLKTLAFWYQNPRLICQKVCVIVHFTYRCNNQKLLTSVASCKSLVLVHVF